MRAVRFHEHGGPDVLTVDEVESPEPGPAEVVVDARAIGVNPVDTYFREGDYPVPDLPFVPGSDVAGVVARAGEEIERLAEGDRVVATGLGNGRSGTYAEEVLAPGDHVAALPRDVSFRTGAALALVGVTAWRALVHHASVEPGETVLIHGGSGGVGHVAVQLAATAGAEVLATASESYRDDLDELGVDRAFDYERDDLAEAIADAGEPTTILDTLADEYFPLDTEVAGEGARIVAIGNATESATVTPLAAAKAKDLRFQFMSMFNTPDLRATLERLVGLCEAGAVAPEIARTYDLEEAGEAQRAVLEDSFLGKLLLVP